MRGGATHGMSEKMENKKGATFEMCSDCCFWNKGIISNKKAVFSYRCIPSRGHGLQSLSFFILRPESVQCNN